MAYHGIRVDYSHSLRIKHNSYTRYIGILAALRQRMQRFRLLAAFVSACIQLSASHWNLVHVVVGHDPLLIFFSAYVLGMDPYHCPYLGARFLKFVNTAKFALFRSSRVTFSFQESHCHWYSYTYRYCTV